jgi:hypothetical protein
LDARHFAVAMQAQHQTIHLALHDLVGDQIRLPHQTGTDGDLRNHFSRVKQFSPGFRSRLLPRKPHRAVHRQVADEIDAAALRAGGAGKLKFRVRRQPLQHDRLQRARGDVEIHRAPAVAPRDCRIEMDFNGKSSAAVELRDKTILVNGHLPFLSRVQAGERNRAGKQFQRTATRVLDLRVRGERERRDVAAEIARQLEIRQRDDARRRARRGEEQQCAED